MFIGTSMICLWGRVWYVYRDEYDTDGVRLFRVRGAGDGQVGFRAEQVTKTISGIFTTTFMSVDW